MGAIRQHVVLFSLSLILAFSIAATAEQPAYGYVDPGSGMLLTQIIGSVVTAAVFSFRRRVASFFRGGNRTAPEGE